MCQISKNLKILISKQLKAQNRTLVNLLMENEAAHGQFNLQYSCDGSEVHGLADSQKNPLSFPKSQYNKCGSK